MSTKDHPLARLLDAPCLPRIVPHLAPETLHQLIRYRGLDACGDLVTSATAAQLTALLDLDLWRQAAPGRDRQFDVDRFGEWLEVLAEGGSSAAARLVAALDPRLVIAGLSRYVRVLDPGIFEPTAQSDDEGINRHEAMREGDRHAPVRDPNDDGLECEVGGYLVRARRADAWDAIVTLLVALETEHNDYFHAVSQGCRSLSNSRPEIDGLDDLLMAQDQHLHDVALERERRLSGRGYATPGDARAFLQLARHARHASGALATAVPPAVVNALVTAYFRAAEEEEDATSGAAPSDAPQGSLRGPKDSARRDDDLPAPVVAALELLAEPGVLPARPRALLEAADEDPRAARLPILRRLMEFLRHHDEAAYFTRHRELAFLANTLQAGSSVQSRPFTPQEASDAAASICNLGLECWSSAAPPDALLVNNDLVAAFEVGWSVLYEDVSLFVADQLMSTLADFRSVDTDTDRELRALHRQLAVHREAGTPWLARGASDVLATLDTTVWITVVGLLDECPILPETLIAVLERRRTPVSPSAFQFISTTAQIGDIRVFMRALAGLLSF